MDEKLQQATEICQKYGQEQLLDAYSRIKDEQDKQSFLDQILTIDFKQIEDIYEGKNVSSSKFNDANVEPIEFVDKYKLPKKEYEKYEKIGTEKIKAGKLAVVTMAGGQGTRLGHNGPKGTFDLGLDSHKSIFEILTDVLKEARKKYEVDIPWYIMTSEENDATTQEFFEENDFFGYPKNCVGFFKQGKLPMVDENGKILIDEHGKIKEASDGHGGIFQSLRRDGVLFDLKSRNIEWVFIGGVDNVLVKPVDPVFVGLACDKNVEAAGKSIIKASPEEKVGVFCKHNGKPSVIEYSEISKEMAEETLPNGELKYAESHILCNLFSLKAIEKISTQKLPYHKAFKKATYTDKNGKVIVPDKPNAYKFEAFLFDAFESLDDLIILRVKREEEFAPVKNKAGQDSPETARILYKNFFKKSNEKKLTYIT